MKPCQQITLEIEKSRFVRLSVKDRLELRMHLAICPACRKYFRDSKHLDDWLGKKFSHATENSSVAFTSEEKEKLKALLKRSK